MMAVYEVEEGFPTMINEALQAKVGFDFDLVLPLVQEGKRCDDKGCLAARIIGTISRNSRDPTSCQA